MKDDEVFYTCKFFYEEYSEEKNGTDILKYKCDLYDNEEKQCSITKRNCSLRDRQLVFGL